MKTINVTFEDKEFAKLEKIKGSRNWRSFIMERCSLACSQAIRDKTFRCSEKSN